MTSTLERPAAEALRPPAQRLRTTMAAMRLGFTWFGTRKTLSNEQKAQAAESFGAEGQFLSAGKKLVDTRHPKFKAVTAVRSRAASYWRGISLPFPEPGLRLIRQDEVDDIVARMEHFQTEVLDAAADLDEHFSELKSVARGRLGDLFDEADYPPSLVGLFHLNWDFPSVEPPEYLQRLSPQLYAEECQRMQGRFDEAIRLAEQAFLKELSKLVDHLTERLSGIADGKPKVFRDSAVSNLNEFFERFQYWNVRSNEQLDELVARAQQVVQGIQPQQLRDNQGTRQRVASQLSGVQSVLDGLLVDRPRRNILRRPK